MQLNKIAVVICNYNTEQYIVRCIQSIMESVYNNLDFYVVDNASTDNSVEKLRETFGDSINLIINTKNLGGSGGFNTGLREALKHGYKYIYLADSDIFIDKNALKELYDYAEDNPNVGIVGSAAYYMDRPQEIMYSGINIDFDNYRLNHKYRMKTDKDELPVFEEFDAVAACSALVRTDALRKLGIMDDGYFIYWDDVDLCKKIKDGGYRIVVNFNSKVWHKGGASITKNTTRNYYGRRNSIFFFVKYINESELEKLGYSIVEGLFRRLFFSSLKNKVNSITGLMIAIDDAINNIRGAINPEKSLPVEPEESKFEKTIEGKDYIILMDAFNINNSENFDSSIILRNITYRIKTLFNDVNILICCKYGDYNALREKMPGSIVIKHSQVNSYKNSVLFQTCGHIFSYRNNIEDNVLYLDGFLNTVVDENDRSMLENYDNIWKMVEKMYLPFFISKLRQLKKEINN